LAIAGVLGGSVDELFGAAPAAAEPVSGRPVPDGAAILAARIGDRVVYAAASDALARVGWPRANAVLAGGRARLLAGADLGGLVVVGCDPALGSLSGMLPSGGSRRLIALSGSTAAALEAMRQGRAHGALVHTRADRMPEPPAGALRLHVARWNVGIASRGPRRRSVAELCARGARVVQRESGASSQKAFLAAVTAQGGPAPAGPIAAGHVEVAQRVVAGAVAGVTMEPAALHFGLKFAGLEQHVAELWIDARWRAHPAVEAVGNVLRSAAFVAQLSLVGGYELAGCGGQKGQIE